METNACVVCGDEPKDGWRYAGSLCGPCGRSHDRANDGDGTIMGVIEWAATRARRFERRRAAEKQAAAGEARRARHAAAVAAAWKVVR